MEEKQSPKRKPDQRLKHERELRGWSQQALAEQIGATNLSVSRWERGVTTPKSHFIHQLCILFDKNAEELGLVQPEEISSSFQRAPGNDFGPEAPGQLPRLRDPAIPSLLEKEGALVGHDNEFRLLKRRLLTQVGSFALYGLPGVGKTALSVALTRDGEISEHFREGLLWAGLGQYPDRMHLLGRWGMQLGMTFTEIARFSSFDRLAAAIRDMIGMRRMLLIIDDAWHIQDALSFKIGGMQCTHLVTTRFPPLARRFANNGAFPLHELNEEESMALLRQLIPRIVTDEPGEAQELVRSVGGLPLALTLMGKYLQMQEYTGQPRRIQRALEQLRHADTRLQLAEPVSPPERNPCLAGETPLSLQAAIAVSDQRLDQQSQEGLRALAVFPAKPNSFSEEAALAVCHLTEKELDALLDAGLLESYRPGRYTLHQTIADYAKVHGFNPAVEESMVLFFVSFIDAHRGDDKGLEEEYRNIMAAFEIAFNRGMAALLQRGINLFAPFWETRSLYAPAERCLAWARQAGLSSDDDEALADTLFHLGRIAELRGDMLSAEQHYQEGLTVARRTALPDLISHLLVHAGRVITNRADYARAEHYLLEGLELASKLDHKQRMGIVLEQLGEIADYRGDYAQGNEFYRQGLELARQAGDGETIAVLLQDMGVKAEWRGAYDLARAYYREGMEHAQKNRDPSRIAAFLMNMGMLAFRQKRYAQAKKHYLEALKLSHKMGNRTWESAVLQNLGMLESACKHEQRAEEYLQDSLRIAREIGHSWLIYETQCEMGELFLKQQRLEQAGGIFKEVLEKAREIGARELAALALYGLARLDATRDDYAGAYQKGQESLALLEKIEHVRKKQIAAWLATLEKQGNKPTGKSEIEGD